MGRVKVVESRVEKGVNHAACFDGIDFIIFHRQAHITESKIFLYMLHVKYSFLLYNSAFGAAKARAAVKRSLFFLKNSCIARL